MSITRKQKGLLTLLAVVLILAWYPMKWKFFPYEGGTVDTTDWKTYCVGRFLIDLPPDAKVSIDPGKIWDAAIVWRQDLTPENLMQEVNKRIESLKTVKHKGLLGAYYSEEPEDGEIWSDVVIVKPGELPRSQYIDKFALPDGGIVLHYWKNPYSTNESIMRAYYITQKGRVLMRVAEVSKDSFDLGKKNAIELAETLRAYDDCDSIPTEAGFCFPGGFSAQTDQWRSEWAGLKAYFPNHPGIVLSGAFSSLDVDGEALSSIASIAKMVAYQARPGVSVLRYRGITLAGGVPAQEFAGIDTNKNYGKIYNFILYSPSVKNRLDRPEIWLTMDNIDDFSMLHSDPFESNDQALGLWEAIKKSIRLRPGAI